MSMLAAGLFDTLPPGARLALRPLVPRETGLPRAVGARLYEALLNAVVRAAAGRGITVLARERLHEVYGTLEEFYQGDIESMLRAARADVEIICKARPVAEGVNLSCGAVDLAETVTVAHAMALFSLERPAAPYGIAVAGIARRLGDGVPAVGPLERVMLMDTSTRSTNERAPVIRGRSPTAPAGGKEKRVLAKTGLRTRAGAAGVARSVAGGKSVPVPSIWGGMISAANHERNHPVSQSPPSIARALGLAAVVSFATACATVSPAAIAQGNVGTDIPVLVMSEDEDPNTVRRSSDIAKRIMSELHGVMKRHGYRIIGEESLAADLGWEISDRRPKRELIESLKQMSKSGQAPHQVHAWVLLRIRVLARQSSAMTVVHTRGDGEIYHAASHQLLDFFDMPREEYLAPKDCIASRLCLGELLDDRAREIASGLGEVLARKLALHSPPRASGRGSGGAVTGPARAAWAAGPTPAPTTAR